MKLRAFSIAAAIVCAAPAAKAATSPFALPFERIPVGARAAGLGGAFSAMADDGTAVYWNPAGLSRGDMGIYGSTFAASYAALSWGRRVSHVALSHQFEGMGVFAVALTHATVGDVPLVDSEGVQKGLLGDSQDAVFLNASNRPKPNLAVGGTVKLFSERLGAYRAGGAALDFGLHWQPWLERPYFVGFVAQDLGGHLSWNTRALDFGAATIRLGQMYEFAPGRLRAAVDVEGQAAAGGSFNARTGAEGKVYPGIWLRAGAELLRQSISAGVSFEVREYSIDYAVTQALSEAGQLEHRVALTGKF